MKKRDIFNVALDVEEQLISDALDRAISRGKLKNVRPLKKELIVVQQTARNTLRKDARVNIRISTTDLNRLKQRAAYKGLPYQTLIAGILHEYAAGHFGA